MTKLRFLYCVILGSLWLFSLSAVAQTSREVCAAGKVRAAQRTTAKKARLATLVADETLDATYYKLNLKITPASEDVVGETTISFRPRQEFTTCFFNLTSELQVDSVKMGGLRLAFTHQKDKIALTFPKKLLPAEAVTITIFYQGSPPVNDFGSFEFSTHGSSRTPIVWSLSEPFGSSDWWPCKENPADKVDSSDVWITMPKSFISVSNGVLEGTTTNGDWKTYRWKNRYPIANYLISVAATNYNEYTNYVKWNATDSMLVSHFTYPEEFTAARKLELNETIPMLKVFSDKFGLYPFYKEKYGHAQCGFGGGMEHQTVSSMGDFDIDLVSHELAHQWFGDQVTCKTWADIWVNEGFASYAEALYREAKSGKSGYDGIINNDIKSAKLAKGTISVQNVESVDEIFDGNRTYAKGSIVLHMLRNILGDKFFFQTLKDYLTTYAYSNASIRDFQQVAEKISGQSLAYFFDQWLFGTGYPVYNFTWQKIPNNGLSLQINQTTKNGTTLFKMPVPIQVTFVDGKDSTLVFWAKDAKNSLKIENLPSAILSVKCDANTTILRDLTEEELPTVYGGILGNEPEKTLVLYPNPTNDYLNLSEISLENSELNIVSATGKKMSFSIIDENKLSIKNFPAGKYFLTIQKQNEAKTFAFVVQ